jgi:hypothetical protein
MYNVAMGRTIAIFMMSKDSYFEDALSSFIYINPKTRTFRLLAAPRGIEPLFLP